MGAGEGAGEEENEENEEEEIKEQGVGVKWCQPRRPVITAAAARSLHASRCGHRRRRKDSELLPARETFNEKHTQRTPTLRLVEVLVGLATPRMVVKAPRN